MNAELRPRDRIVFLDGLRGVAALLVVFFHCSAAFFPAVAFGGTTGLSHALNVTPILNLPFQGDFMVCIFYALSGLALSYHTLSRGSRAPAISGLARRYPRLMVPCLAGILVSAGLLAAGLYSNAEAAALSGSPWWGERLSFPPSLHLAVKDATVTIFRNGYSSFDPPLWTMHNELLGSLLVFAVLLIARPQWIRVVAYVALAWLTRGTYLLAFVGGMAVCEAWLTLGDHPRRWRSWLVPVGILGLILGSYPIPGRTTPDFYSRVVPNVFGSTQYREWVGAHVVGAVLVLAAVVAVVPVRRPLETVPARFLGRISFSLYIVHYLVLSSLGAWLLIELQHILPYVANALLASAVVVLVSILVAWVFTRLIDEPALALTGQGYRALSAQLRRLTGRAPLSRAEGDSPDERPIAPVASEPT